MPLPERLSPRIDEVLLPAKPLIAPNALPPVSARPAAPLPTPATAPTEKPEAVRTVDPPESAAAKPQSPPAEVSDTKLDRAGATGDIPASDPGSSATAALGGQVQKLDAPHGSPLGISDLRLCRQVFGFGSFEPMASERIKVGQHLLVYCELTGVQYDVREADFVSRISSRVEIKAAHGGAVLWKRELGDAEDVCRRRRRDYYVNYRVELPKTLGPGSYRLRLLQTDLVAGYSTSGEIPLEIMP